MLNEKQEKFSQAYVLHRNATEAAKAAGYAAESAYNQGYRLLQKQEVIDRVHELEQELVTDVDVIKEMESQYEFAKANGHTNSAIKALELLSRIRGSSTDGKIATDKDTLEVAIIGCLNVLGYEKVISLLEKCDFAHHFFEDTPISPPESLTEGPSLESVDLPLPEEADSLV
jgi:phage terminase small subunit